MNATLTTPTTRRLLLAAAVLAVTLPLLTGWLADLLWFRALGLASVFWRLLLLRLILFVAVGAAAWAYLHWNLRVLRARVDLDGVTGGADAAVLRIALRLVVALVALVTALIAAADWDALLRFVWGQPAGRSDPVFGHDIGFYLFTLPLIEALRTPALVLATAVAAALVVVYAQTGRLRYVPFRGVEAPAGVVRHVGINLAALLGLWALGYWLDRFEVLTDSAGAVYGAGWTDVTVRLPLLWLMVAASAVLALAFVVCAVSGRTRWLTPALAAWLVAAVVAAVVPAGFQAFVVEPNELELERPYLERNIAATRRAFGLDAIESRQYAPGEALTRAGIEASRQTVDNIRIWDWRPLARTFAQLQQIRSYYRFRDVDVDRYTLGGERAQLMLSARELAADLPGTQQSWVNRRLQFTHGFGVVASPAAEKDAEGQPRLVVRDLPPRTPPGLAIERPEIYYGEADAGYRVVATGIKEFDYPRGDDNVYAHYAGTGGVPLDAGWKRALFALTTGDLGVLLSGYVDAGSRIQLNRAVQQRLATVAPFLGLDPDPYIVIHDGRLVWLQDMYTTARRWPYSEPLGNGVNYIRNAVKATVDAYDGDLRLYAMTPDDPVLATYRAALPALFTDVAAMPEGLRQHIRYPQRLFEAQIAKYSTYHMTVPQVFYNREDVWAVPRERYGGETLEMAPYYILMRLPGETGLEFLLMQPLTPANRDNMIAWVAARSDPPRYGELVAYKLPKERLIFGPAQIEAKIDQDTRISRQLSLWDQRGSSVTRGNLLVIPIGESFLYVEPVYLRADNNDLPQLKRIIVSDGRHIAMEPTLERALAVVFGDRPRRPAGDETVRPRAGRGVDAEAARRALEAARQALAEGDWQTFAERMTELEALLAPDGD